MGPVAKLYLKLFGGLCVIFLICSGVPAVTLAVGEVGGEVLPFAILITVLVVLPAAAAVALFLVILQVRAVKRLGVAVTAETLGMRQMKAVVLPCGYAEARERCLAAIRRAMPRATVTDGAPLEEGVLHARTGLTWDSWGERIQFRLRRKNADWTMVTVSSRPRIYSWVIDLGRNLKNVEKIVENLQQPVDVAL